MAREVIQVPKAEPKTVADDSRLESIEKKLDEILSLLKNK